MAAFDEEMACMFGYFVFARKTKECNVAEPPLQSRPPLMNKWRSSFFFVFVRKQTNEHQKTKECCVATQRAVT